MHHPAPDKLLGSRHCHRPGEIQTEVRKRPVGRQLGRIEFTRDKQITRNNVGVPVKIRNKYAIDPSMRAAWIPANRAGQHVDDRAMITQCIASGEFVLEDDGPLAGLIGHGNGVRVNHRCRSPASRTRLTSKRIVGNSKRVVTSACSASKRVIVGRGFRLL